MSLKTRSRRTPNRRYAQVRVELELTARMVDLVREGFDFALRVAAARPKSSTLVARKVGTVVLQLYHLQRTWRAVPRRVCPTR